MPEERQARIQFESDESLAAALEAILFIYGEPMEAAELAKILGENRERIIAVAEMLSSRLTEGKRGLRIVSDGTSLQITTAPEFSEVVQRVIKHEFSEELSSASLETLAIVAYRGPISRSEVDYIRGVNSTFMLRSLLIRGLVSRRENPARPNSYVYTISMDSLKFLGIEKPEDLPEYKTYHELSYEHADDGKFRAQAADMSDPLSNTGNLLENP